MGKDAEFEHYIYDEHNWSHEAFIPAVLKPILEYAYRYRTPTVPVPYIGEAFREIYAQRERQGKIPVENLRSNCSKECSYIFNNITTVEDKRLCDFLILRPLTRLGKGKSRPGQSPYYFIDVDKRYNVIVINSDIFKKLPDRYQNWINHINAELRDYFILLDERNKTA